MNIARKTEIYKSIKSCKTISKKDKEKSFVLLKRIIKSQEIEFFDNSSLKDCFSFKVAEKLKFGTDTFWNKIYSKLLIKK